MTDRDTRPAKLLFVISRDHGELSNAMSLLAGQAFPAVVVVPETLHAANVGLAADVRPYRSAADVLDVIAAEAPDIVFLFSAYLYAVNRILGLDDVERLVGRLRTDGRVVVTSDPFLGIFADLDTSTFDARHPRHDWLVEHFGRLRAILRDVAHLYPVPMESIAGTPAVSFFNPHVLVPPSGSRGAGRALEVPGIDPSRPRWLFVLSGEDWNGQVLMHGRAGFAGILAGRLADAARQHRQPVLIAPGPCVDDVRAHAACPREAVLLAFCGHDVFSALLLDAEAAFYWNVFSNSVAARAVNERPVYFFDRGHMAVAMPALVAVGMARYYPGSTLTYLDVTRPLVAEELAELGAAQHAAMAAARENLRRSPTPEAMIARLLETRASRP